MAASNDLRGWVMSAVSGIACVLGSTVICADLVLRRLTHYKSFQIANSNNFLAASLCLSAGVMLFTSLYSMLPTSKEYLSRAGFSSSTAAYLLTGLFLTGIIVIRIVSGFIHRFIPSNVVDCAHTHDEPETDPERGDGPRHGHHPHGDTEHTPLLRPPEPRSFKSTPAVAQRPNPDDLQVSDSATKESLRAMVARRFSSLMGGVKPLCDENGPCYGFSQTCGRECTKILPPMIAPSEISRPGLPPHHQSIAVQLHSGETHPNLVPNTGHNDTVSAPHSVPASSSSSSRTQDVHSEHLDHSHQGHDDTQLKPTTGNPHHHHVPQNAFLSIGLQTSLAIALHKLPEGFITYATNHANPKLGLTVFLALFVHNITEGFAMALPLYLALSSRWKAMFWSSLLGGISQPAGAGLAALWIWGSGRHNGNDATGPSWGVYGGMFAATAGVMTSVALQLFSEGIGLTHNRGMGIGFAVAGMGLMGLSFALTA
ncbi:hypothetical protein N7474_007401 [Penicillium riverlandense]|uniref:uncharacterized protein n=1 Tax=Penicillium riverlandense TaxID=1903569 RepID=UPI0025485C22|nr:uncharacterized protein N7474_007401 [Penicillium riverlandense]KAJ5815624.1 hypothetical protein N7474_007401 [Penicillium riverlandense]